MSQFLNAATGRGQRRRLGFGHGGLRGGFTLVELLVVIGIIALLISILLPTLASARRSANSVKCLASLKEVGNAFSMYAMENKGMYPAVRDSVNQYTSKGVKAERRWTDLLAKYLNKKGSTFETNADLAAIRSGSVLWGCPEWAKSFDYNAAASAGSGEMVYNGYGMQYYPGFFEHDYSDPYNAYRGTTPTRVGYFKQTFWGRRGSDRLLVADSVQDIIALPSSVALAKMATYTTYQGFNTKAVGFMPYIQSATTSDDFVIDSRHMKPGTPKAAAINMKSINALFCDGHAASVSPREAFNAIHNPGQDTTGK